MAAGEKGESFSQITMAAELAGRMGYPLGRSRALVVGEAQTPLKREPAEQPPKQNRAS